MAEPSLGDVHVDTALTDFSLANFQADDRFVWRRTAPMIDTARQSNKYYVWDRASLLRTDTEKRAPGTPAARRNFELSNSSFFCDVRSIAFAVSEQVRANSDTGVDFERSVVKGLTQDQNIALDVDWAAAFFAAGIWGTDTNVNWADAASTPIQDIATGVKTVLQNTGYKPNTLVLGAETWYDALWNHPDVISRLPDNAPRIATPQFLANLFDIDNVMIAESVRNTAAEGLAGSYSFNAGASALLAYTDPNPGLGNATAMASFNWSGLVGASGGVRVSRYSLPAEDAIPLIEVTTAFDFAVTAAELGYFFTTTTS
jgi:hypothetical protein